MCEVVPRQLNVIHELIEARRRQAAENTLAGETAVEGLLGRAVEMARERKQKWVDVFNVPKQAIQLLQTWAEKDPDYAKVLETSVLWKSDLHLRTTCSGVGAAETAARIVAAARNTISSEGEMLKVVWVGACEKDPHHQQFLKKQMSSSHVHKLHIHKDMLNWLSPSTLKEVQEAEAAEQRPFAKVKRIILNSELLPGSPCACHSFRACARTPADVDISGTPCIDYSARNRNKRGLDGPNAKIMLVWAKLLLADDVKVAIHENTPGFPIAAVIEILEEKYVHIPFEGVTPGHGGVRILSRPRRVDIFLHKKLVKVTGDIKATFEQITSHAKLDGMTLADLFCEDDMDALKEEFRNVSSEHNVAREAMEVLTDNLRFGDSWGSGLTDWQHEVLHEYGLRWKEKFKALAYIYIYI